MDIYSNILNITLYVSSKQAWTTIAWRRVMQHGQRIKLPTNMLHSSSLLSLYASLQEEWTTSVTCHNFLPARFVPSQIYNSFRLPSCLQNCTAMQEGKLVKHQEGRKKRNLESLKIRIFLYSWLPSTVIIFQKFFKSRWIWFIFPMKNHLNTYIEIIFSRSKFGAKTRQ
jgi:hypothetical protein